MKGIEQVESQLKAIERRRKKKMGKALLKVNIKREPGKLYYLATSSDGYLVVCEAMLSRGGRKKKDASQSQ